MPQKNLMGRRRGPCGHQLYRDRWCPACEIRHDPSLSPSALPRSGAYWRRPSKLTFHGKGRVYLGLELEVTDRSGLGAQVAMSYLGDKQQYGWLVGDASVYGFEMNAQPMTYQWALRHFPWKMLTACRMAGSEIMPDSNGIHVHVNRNGFDGPAHEFSWMKFLYRNQRQVIAIARRHSSQWGHFTRAHQRAQYGFARTAPIAGRLLETPQGAPEYQQLMGKLQRIRAEAVTAGKGANLYRPAAINANTHHGTHEVRVFASTLRPQRAKAALGLIDSTVAWTRLITVGDIVHDDAWGWDAYTRWLAEQGRLYAPLRAEIAERIH